MLTKGEWARIKAEWIPNGKETNWNGHELVFESEPDDCTGCFFADKDSCPDCDEGLWVEENPSPWHTGTPTEGGLFLVYLKDGTYDIYEFGKEYMAWDIGFSDVVAWQKIEPYKEKEDGHID